MERNDGTIPFIGLWPVNLDGHAHVLLKTLAHSFAPIPTARVIFIYFLV